MFLEETNTELRKTLAVLKETQEKLVESEKMAALGKLVAGIAHEINTPMGVGVTAASYLKKLTETIAEQYASQTMKKSDLEQFISKAEQATSMVLENLKRSYKLINSFKMIAVSKYEENLQPVKLKEYIQEILLSLNSRIKNSKHRIIIQCPDDLEIKTYLAHFSHIITNLITNSLVHGYPLDKQGKIVINIKKTEDSVVINYSDDGCGIEKKNLKKIFEPFFTTNREHGGTGLGLHLVYNIVTQTFGGTIRCISEKDNGAAFEIIMPMR